MGSIPHQKLTLIPSAWFLKALAVALCWFNCSDKSEMIPHNRIISWS